MEGFSLLVFEENPTPGWGTKGRYSYSLHVVGKPLDKATNGAFLPSEIAQFSCGCLTIVHDVDLPPLCSGIFEAARACN